MAIRTVEFSVTQGGIAPAVKQFGGVQGEHRSTKAVFKLDSGLYSAIVQQADDASGSAVYRIDGYDGEGGVSRSETSPLTGGEVSYYLEEWITRYGGTVKAVLVVSVLKDDTTEMELYSFPALLQLKNLPAGTDTSGESYESMSTLSQAAKDAAERASQSAQAAEDAQNATELARFALENGSTVIFDGNGTFGLADPVFVVDETLSESSGNAVANKTVTAKFNSLEEDLSSQISEVEENADTEIAKCELKSNKTDVFPEGITETILKTQYPSMKFINDMVRVVETGTSGIWTYRKWSDGTAECWGVHWFQLNLVEQYQNVWAGQTFSLTLPSGLFNSSTGYDTTNVQMTTDNLWSASCAEISQTQVKVKCFSGYKYQNAGAYVFISIKGKWEQEG